MALSYHMLPKPNGVVGGSNPSCEISLDGKLARWSSACCVQIKEKKKHSKFYVNIYSEVLCKLIVFATLAFDFHRYSTLGSWFEKLR